MYIGEAYGGPKDPGAAKSSLSLKEKEQSWLFRQQDYVENGIWEAIFKV